MKDMKKLKSEYDELEAQFLTAEADDNRVEMDRINVKLCKLEKILGIEI